MGMCPFFHVPVLDYYLRITDDGASSVDPKYHEYYLKWLNSFVEHGWKLNPEMLDMINQYSAKAQEYLTTDILPQMQDMLKNVSAGIFDILIFMKNFLIGAIVALYVLADKEKFVAKSKMMVYAILPHKWANMLIRVMRFTDKTFGGFIYGKLLDSAIIGILCYFGMLLLDLPYPILISVIIGVTNVIPFFGHYIGAIPCILLILVVDPIKGLYFAIFILLLQQFDGNILGPKILGDSTGLSSFMVIVAIMIGGGLFGVPEEETYINIDCLDEQTGEVLPLCKEEKHKVSPEELEARKNNFFMKIWNPLSGLVITIWKYLLRILNIIWGYIKKAGIFLKNRYVELKNKREKNK